ncbi:MAG: HAD hydrolase-like protein [Hyphomicrobiales bacterium]|nr:HAD hydrolase-like protein [Hyphomicrobiales bacterium]
MLPIDFDTAWRTYRAAEAYLPAKAPAVRPRRVSGLREVAGDFDLIVLDAYGVLHDGGDGFPFAQAAVAELQAAGKAVCVLTNDASGDKAQVAARSAQRGYDFAADAIVAGTDLLPDHLDRFDGWGVVASWPLPYPQRLDALPRLDRDRAAYDAVAGILFLDSDTWTTAAQRALTDSLCAAPRPVLVANPDVACPQGGGMTAEPGFYLHWAGAAAGVTPAFIGKPHGGVYDLVKARHPHVPPARMLAVGDTPHTDILGARAAGLRAMLVETGFTRGRDPLALAADSGIWPDFVAPRL